MVGISNYKCFFRELCNCFSYAIPNLLLLQLKQHHCHQHCICYSHHHHHHHHHRSPPPPPPPPPLLYVFLYFNHGYIFEYQINFFADQNIEDVNLDSFDSCSLQNTNDPDVTSGPTGNLSTVATIEGHDQTSKL